MVFQGIQAEMTIEGYFPVPGHYSCRNKNANSCVWPFNNVDNFFNNGNYYNGALFLPSPDQHLVQSKEVVKQTMLKHEAIFKDQICELHRIYWRHRELIDEMEKNKLLKHQHHRELGTLQSNPLSPQDLCDYAQKTSLVLSLPGVNPAFYRSSVPTVENDLSLSHFNDRRFAHSGPDPAQTELSLKGHELESSKKLGKRILDLELPPIEYIDSEDEESLQKVPEVSGDPLNRISEAVHKSDWQPYHGSGGFNLVFQEHILNPGSVSFKKNLLADLNEPIKFEEKLGTISIYLPDLNELNKIEEVAVASKFLVDLNEPIKFEEEAALSSDFQSPLAGHAELSCQDLAPKSSSGFQVSPTDMKHNTKTGRDSETCSNDLHLEKYDDEAGQSRRDVASLSPGHIEEVSASLQNFDLKQAHEHDTSHFMNQRKKKSYGEGLETLGKSLPSNSNPVPVSNNNVGTPQLISLTDIGSSKPSSISPSKKQICDIVRTPIIVQGLPCSNSSLQLRKHSKSSITGPGVAGKRSCHGKGLKLSPKFDNANFNQSTFCNESSAESKTLESRPPSISSNGQDVSEENDLAFEHHGPTKLEDLVRGLPWLKTQSLRKRKCIESSEPSNLVETHQNPSEDEANKKGANDGINNINLDCNPVFESGEQVASSHKLVVGSGLEKEISCFGAGIDVNSCMEDDESSPTSLLPKDLGLEAPVSPENKENSPPRKDSDENQFEMPSKISGKEDGDVREYPAQNAVEAMVVGEDVDMQEDLSRNAATALVSISSSVVPICPETAACEPSEPSRSDELHWFAKVVFSVVDDPESKAGVVLSSKNNGDYEGCMLNGLDYFETMTLNLIETKVEEADRFNTNDQEGKKEEERGANYFPSQQRRGRMRRARQQRNDFQSEILPSLASLSRCEVTEDLQTIERLIEAANSKGGTVHTRSISRNARARGRKRSCIPTSNLTDNTICSPSKQHTRITDTQERRLTLGGVGWGSITRRRRGPRSPATNPWLR